MVSKSCAVLAFLMALGWSVVTSIQAPTHRLVKRMAKPQWGGPPPIPGTGFSGYQPYCSFCGGFRGLNVVPLPALEPLAPRPGYEAPLPILNQPPLIIEDDVAPALPTLYLF